MSRTGRVAILDKPEGTFHIEENPLPEIKPGEIHALMGPNGSGKSSFALALAGHPRYRITSGRVVLDGKNITRLAPDKRARLGLFLALQLVLQKVNPRTL